MEGGAPNLQMSSTLIGYTQNYKTSRIPERKKTTGEKFSES